jgi:YHS domain-containing protein
VHIRFIAAVVMLAAALLAAPAASRAATSPAATPAAAAPSLPSASQPEFEGQCAMALAEGKSDPTDCSVKWSAPDGKLYCFGSEKAKKQFLEDPQGNIERARTFLAASEVDITTERMTHYESADVSSFVSAAIADTASKNAGVYPLFDPVSGQHLKLVFDHVDFVRTLAGYGYFPDVAFNAQDEPAKHYLVDFWIKPTQDKLQLIDTRIYKAPKRDGAGWMLQTRQPIPWWWIPASEHPGKTENTRGWEVMSAVEEDIVKRRADNHGTVKLTDAKTGEQLDLDFIGTHQPVRRLTQDGRYFMCTDFRKAGTTDQYYDIDFWVNEHAGKLTVDDVKVHKVPEKQQDGSYIQVPRYNFDDLKFDVVP